MYVRSDILTAEDGSFPDLMKLTSLPLVLDACSDAVLPEAVFKGTLRSWNCPHRILQHVGLFWGTHFE